MFSIWSILKLFIMIPALSLTAGFAAGYFIQPGVLAWVTALFTGLFLFCFELSRDRKKIQTQIRNSGLNPDYKAIVGINAIIIDTAKECIFAGCLSNGIILGFKDVVKVEWEDRNRNHFLHIHTNKFDQPRITVGFANRKGLRDDSFGKLRAALNFT